MHSSGRRAFLQQAFTGTLALTPSMHGLLVRLQAGAFQRERLQAAQAAGYGPLARIGPELALPAGFSYSVLSYTGKPMTDGSPTPGAFDGMAAFPLPNGHIRLIRNHENRDRPWNTRPKGDQTKAYDPKGAGCVSSLEVRIAGGTVELVRDFISLTGTIVNCAGGPTPWQSWLTCEESVEGKAHGWTREHGYIFEIPVSAESEVAPVPLKAMGRFVHEAVAVDPATGIVYETEDRLVSGFYRFLPTRRGMLSQGGALEMLAIDGRPNLDTAGGQRAGVRYPVRWIPIPDPDPGGAWEDSSAVFRQGFDRGAARFARLERRVDVDLVEAGAMRGAHAVAVDAVGRDESGDHDRPGLREQRAEKGIIPQDLDQPDDR